jgi:hypothetical protein
MEKEKKEENKIYSTHSFLFPFVIEAKSKKTNLDINTFSKNLCVENWKRKYFSSHDSVREYNKKSYFYGHVYDAFFPKVNEPNPMIAYFEKYFGDEFKITLEDKTEYKLKIEIISLFVFDTSIGILCFDLFNTDDKHSSPEDILKINDFGRRVYPQFISETEGIERTKKTFLADRIDILDKGEKIFLDPIGEFTEEWFFNKNDDPRKIKIAPYILHILGDQFLSTGDFSIKPIIDDRMFTVCWYGSNEQIKELQAESPKDGSFTFENDDFWYKYIFIDGGKNSCCPNPVMKRKLIKQTTYDRWVSINKIEGSIFGLSRHSLVCLTNFTDIDGKLETFVQNQMPNLYKYFAVILLTQRATIIKFSGDVSDISKKIKALKQNSTEQNIHDVHDEVKKLNEDIIHFINRMWFKEVTAQEQGIEMYGMVQLNMNLQSQLDELKNEISQLYEFMNLDMQRQATKTATAISIISGVFFPITLIATICGMDLYFMKIFYGGFKGAQIPARMPYILVTTLMFLLSIIFSVSYTKKILENVGKKHFVDQIKWGKVLFSSFKGVWVWLPFLFLLLSIFCLIWPNFFR